MRTMLKILMPVGTGNRAYKDGTLGQLFESFMEKYKPESAYFYPENGKRAALFVFDMPDPTHIPPVAEKFFSGLDAEVYLTPVMNAEDLKAGIQKTKQ